MSHRIASVPFLNARPLVWAFEQPAMIEGVEVSYALPSRLPAKLDSGETDAVLVSSIDALTGVGRRIAAGCSISSRGPVMSVKLFSRVPFSKVNSLALDASSLTSNALARIVLRRMFGVSAEAVAIEPDGEEMLAGHDACVLIGDKGLVFDPRGLYELDLGQAWLDLTGLPFVWACWVGKERLGPELAGLLLEARRIGEANLPSVANEASLAVGQQLAHRYLTTVFDYRLEAAQIEGLSMFRDFLLAEGIVEVAELPEVVGAEVGAVSR